MSAPREEDDGKYALTAVNTPVLEKVEPFIPLPYLEAIGHLAVRWSYVESAIEILLWCFLRLSRRSGKLLTTHLSMKMRMEALNLLASDHFLPDSPGNLNQFNQIISEVEQVQKKRNDFIHNLWRYEPDPHAPAVHSMKVSAHGKFKEQINHILLSDIERTVSETTKLTEILRGTAEALFPDADLPWPRTTHEEADKEY
jgi:hypothetical protein